MISISTADLRIIAEKMEHGRIIEAIKDLRSITNLGLKEAKDVVDAARNTRRDPDRNEYLSGLYSQLSGRMGMAIQFDSVAPVTLLPSMGQQTNSPGYTSSGRYQEGEHYGIAGVLTKQSTMLERLLTSLLEEQKETNQLLKDLLEMMSE